MILTNKKIIISGGAGFLGQHLIQFFQKHRCEITIISRDEHKHNMIRRKFPGVKTFICDVRDYDMLRYYTKSHDIGIWAASLKHIDTCTNNWQMAKEIIVDGAINSRKVSEEFLESAVFISTDKSKSPTTLYGQLKAAAGEMFITNPDGCNLTSVVYGNVWNSTGSVIPVIWDHINTSTPITLFSNDMTRFMIEPNHAVDMVSQSLSYSGCHIVPKIPSFKVRDLFEIFQEKFGLTFNLGQPRSSEKIHEVMATVEESSRMSWHDIGDFGFYSITPDTRINEINFPSGDYSSKDFCVSKCQLTSILERYDYFKPHNQ